MRTAISGLDPRGDATDVPSRRASGTVNRAGLLPVAQVLARAFQDNPLNVAVIRARSRRRYLSNLAGMRALLDVSVGRALLLQALTAERGAEAREPLGVLIGARPYGYPLPGPSLLGTLRCLIGQGPRAMGRWAEVYRALEVEHPLEPHWYLAVLGIAPEHQRRGNGAALLAAFLETVDADGGPSYLETDRAENIAFYAQGGYEVVREVTVLGVPVWCMWRPAREESERGAGPDGGSGDAKGRR